MSGEQVDSKPRSDFPSGLIQSYLVLEKLQMANHLQLHALHKSFSCVEIKGGGYKHHGVRSVFHTTKTTKAVLR
jgi:hypothetical protein